MDGYEVRTLHLERTCKYSSSSCTYTITTMPLQLKRSSETNSKCLKIQKKIKYIQQLSARPQQMAQGPFFIHDP